MPAVYVLLVLLLSAGGCTSGCTSVYTPASSDEGSSAPQGAAIDRSLGPHSVRVDAVTSGCREEPSAYLCTLRVETVHAYGPSTRPFARGDEVEVRVAASLAGGPDEAGERLQPGRRLNVTLQQQPRIGGAVAGSPEWVVLALH